MQRYLQLALSLFTFFILLLVSRGASAQSAALAQAMCADKISEQCINTAYHELRKHGSETQWHRQVMACEHDYHKRQVWWREYYRKYPVGKFLGKGPEESSAADRQACLNTLNRMSLESRVARMDAEFQERRRIAEAKRRQEERDRKLAEARQRFEDYVYNPRPVRAEDVKKPEPVAKAEAAEDDGTSADEAAALLDAEDASKPATEAPKPRRTAAVHNAGHTRSSSAGNAACEPYVHGKSSVDAERYRQWRLRYPEAAKAHDGNKPAYSRATHPGTQNARINCVPEHVRIVKVEDNGDAELFIGAGADIFRLQQCMPNHDWDAKRNIKENIAAATIPYTLEFADKPMNRNKLNFHQGRWRIKRADWKTMGAVFYADWLRENSGKEIGFALQGGQRLKLFAKAPTGTAPSKPNAVENTKHGTTTGYLVPHIHAPENPEMYAEAVQVSKIRMIHGVRGLPAQPESRYAKSAPTAERRENQPMARAEIGAVPRVDRGLYTRKKPTAQAFVRAGPRSDRDLHLLDNVHRVSAHDKMWHRGHYGPFAFG